MHTQHCMDASAGHPISTIAQSGSDWLDEPVQKHSSAYVRRKHVIVQHMLRGAQMDLCRTGIPYSPAYNHISTFSCVFCAFTSSCETKPPPVDDAHPCPGRLRTGTCTVASVTAAATCTPCKARSALTRQTRSLEMRITPGREEKMASECDEEGDEGDEGDLMQLQTRHRERFEIRFEFGLV